MMIVLAILSILTILGTFIPVHSSKFWFIRGQSNFKAVYFFLNISFIVLIKYYGSESTLEIILMILLFQGSIYCLWTIIPYTPLYPKSIKSVTGESGEDLHILIHNVYQHNTKYDALIEMINKLGPDIVLLLETDQDWDNAMKTLSKDFAYQIKEIRDDTYGIIMMSKIKLNEKRINHFVKKSIPSSEVVIEKANRKIRIIGLHPEPPIPGEVESSLPKEKEIISAARYLEKQTDDELQILIGDLNDVAWSKVSKRFKKITGLKDPREGRGFFSTFPTYSPIRIPLDHVFCSDSFSLVDFQTMEKVGSDHFPVNVVFRVPEKDTMK